MIFGYSRVSTYAQAHGNSLTSQERELKHAGAQEVFADIYTGAKLDRPELKRLLDTIEQGDTLIVAKLDRVARSAKEGLSIIDDLFERGVNVRILNMGTVDSSPMGRCMRTIFFAFAELERELIIARTREGKAIAKAKPGYQEGRPRKFSEDDLKKALELLKNHSYTEVTKLTGISRSSLKRARKHFKGADA